MGGCRPSHRLLWLKWKKRDGLRGPSAYARVSPSGLSSCWQESGFLCLLSESDKIYFKFNYQIK